MVVNKEVLEEIATFIGEELFRLKGKLQYLDIDKTVVSMPDWLLQMFQAYFRTTVSYSERQELLASHFYGSKIQSHFKNEVVVFYRDYHMNPELFEPKIYIINQ